MQIIEDISNEASQKHTITIETGDDVVLELIYRPTQLGWYIDITYNDFVLRGIRVATSLNFLWQWHSLIPFGLMCECDGNQEPLSVEDFLVGRATLSILTQEEVNTIAGLLADAKA
ncbi:hypothetical protein AAIR98_000911 [Elusimicrobium simillimum]|uniref:phage baseplate plug family protein n=1 Tax=Elusimicrobium simillimum TaxID=3143438 RepID=UPI003C705A2A